MPEPVPLELVDMIIDHVGSGHRRVRRPPPKEDCTCKSATITYQTLKNCALVAKSWTCRSHKNLFKGIMFTVDEEEGIHDLILPPEALLKFVKSLAIHVTPENRDRGSITSHLLSMFSVCPLESLQIEGGLLPLNRRLALRACFGAISGELLDLTFRFCFFEPEPLRDILAIQNTKANITFLGCDQDHPDDLARNDIHWPLVSHNEDRTLCVMGGEEKPSEEFLIDLSELSDATQYLIDASAGVVSFLKLNVISNMSSTLPHGSSFPCHPLTFSLVYLSELVLNMKGSYSCIIETPGIVLATLLEANCTGLSRITVEVEDSQEQFLTESRRESVDSWNNLDRTLATLAQRSTNARGKKLIFVLEVTCMDDTIHRVKKWLPRLLPRFNEDGSLHVHDGEDDDCDFDDYDVEDGKACMGRAVLKEYEYESESDEKVEECDATKRGGGNKEDHGSEGAMGSKEESDEGNEADDEDEERSEENEEDE
ncbi:hypothetical protein BDM02DRAFT_3115829 [Thelephora ganbajun]|uniref:Uncharacterized protein n=1 Tax=Thelephora ganbajun TaxID=370292 RepID=A0ACB6ZF46_THEGA|nr:hypothetical protein BDM02DRAFT_3115829 [Thelephora ganbajun]